jgi:hypothetical protein
MKYYNNNNNNNNNNNVGLQQISKTIKLGHAMVQAVSEDAGSILRQSISDL